MAIDWTETRGQEGFFTVRREAKTGFWWLVDPAGECFHYQGVCGVNRAGTIGGRFAIAGPYAETVDRQFGYAKEGPERFVQDTLEKLRTWGFNALGSWATVEFFERGMPYTEVLEFSKIPEVGKIRAMGMNIADVFDPAWEDGADRLARELCWPRRESRDLIGYFTDNELGWAQIDGLDVDVNPEDVSGAKRPGMLAICLSLPPEQPAHQEARQRLGGDNAEANLRTFGCPIQSLSELAAWLEAGNIIRHPDFLALHRDFSIDYARRYFEVCARSIRRYDPNHLVLGCRFGGPPGPFVAAEAKAPNLDILSANNYRDTFYERVTPFSEPANMPILNGEFAWASGYFTERPAEEELASGEEWAVDKRAVVKGERALRKAVTHPNLIGYTWYRWVSRLPKNPPIQYGLVDFNGDVSSWNTDLLKRLNPELGGIRQAAMAEA